MPIVSSCCIRVAVAALVFAASCADRGPDARLRIEAQCALVVEHVLATRVVAETPDFLKHRNAMSAAIGDTLERECAAYSDAKIDCILSTHALSEFARCDSAKRSGVDR